MPRRPLHPVESAARRDLRAFPDEYGKSALAETYLLLAKRLDAGIPTREAASVSREMRMTLVSLHELAGEQVEDDFVDELQQKREKRMTAGTAP